MTGIPKVGQRTDEALNVRALEVARLAVEDVLNERRDARLGVLGRGNGFCVNERDGSPNGTIRLGTPEGLRIGILAYLAAVPDVAETIARDIEARETWAAQRYTETRSAFYEGYRAGAEDAARIARSHTTRQDTT